MKISQCTENIQLLLNIDRITSILPPIEEIMLNSEPDYYGASHIISKHLGLKETPISNANWNHGWFRYPLIHPQLLIAATPKINNLVATNEQSLYLQENGFESHAIGVPFVYVDDVSVQRIPNSVLIMPSHATTHVMYKTDTEKFKNDVNELINNFEFVVACISGMCVKHGNWIKYFENLNIPWITGAWIYDKNALNRMQTILKSFEYVATNSFGSHIPYAAFCGCKVFTIGDMFVPDPEKMISEPFYKKNPNLIPIVVKYNSERYLREKHPYFFNGVIGARDMTDWAKIELGEANKKDPSVVAELLSWDIKSIFSTKNEKTALFFNLKNNNCMNINKDIFNNENNNYSENKFMSTELQNTDCLISSYPRSGNTWLRLLISDLILQIHGFETDTKLPIHQDRIIPDIHIHNINCIDERITLAQRIIKSHNHFDPTPDKTIFLFRNPADCLCSYFYFHQRYEHLIQKTLYGIDSFCLHFLKEWIDHTRSYLDAYRAYPNRIIFISYESLHNDPFETMKLVVDFLNIEANERMINIAIDNHSFKKHHENELMYNNLRYLFFRKGKIGDGDEKINSKTLNAINRLAIPLYKKASFFQNNINICKNIIIKIKENLIENNFVDALKLISEIKARKYNVQNIDYYRAKAFFGINQLQSAIEAAKEELRYYPNNFEAAFFLETLSSQNDVIPKNSSKNLREFKKIYSLVKAYTMLGRDRLISLFTIAKKCCELDIPGNFVECGVAAGGSSALLAWVINTYSKRPRFLYCFDTFEGMPDPTIEDSHANTPANDTGWGAGTCAASMHSLMDICDKIGTADIIRPTKGLFKNTLPQKSKEIGHIAFLHMDGDWYESTRDILENLYDQVIPQGYIQVDDYGHWDGCRKALHEYESKLGVSFDLHRIDNTGVWFKKPDSPADTATSRLLNLGCGKRHHPAWTNVDFKSSSPDVIAHDLGKGLPFDSEAYDVVYHSHLLEHFSKEYAPVFLKDCYRVLKPEGILRVVVPDLENIARLYLILLEKSLKGDGEAQKRYEWIMLELFDQMVRNHSGGAMLEYWRQNPMPAEDFIIDRLGSEVKDAIAKIRSNPDSRNQSGRQPSKALDPHKIGQFRLSGEIHHWMYDRYSLGKLLQEAGFVDIKVCRAEESLIPDFNSYLLDIEADGSVRKPDSLFMEARKPEDQSIESPHAKESPKTGPIIAQFCMQDYGGAGTAALRLHDGLFSSGMNSTFYVHNVQRWKPGTVPLFAKSSSAPIPHKKIVSNDWKAFQAHNKRLISKYSQRPQGLEMFTDTWAAPKLSEIPDIVEADIIHLHWIAGTVDIPREVEFLKSKKIVWTLHDMNAFTGGCHYSVGCQKYEQHCGSCPQLGSNRDNDLSRQIWTRKMAAYRQLDMTIVTPSQWLADCARKSALLSSFPLHVIPYGLPTDIFKPYPQAQIRESLQVPKDAFVILFGADSLTNARKGFVHLLRALEHLKSFSSSDQIALATFGHHAQAAAQPLGFPTFAFDYVDKESELALVYSMADVTVIPSLEDNLPNNVLESLACGTPVVGFDVGGIPDMVEHQVSGFLAEVGNEKRLAEGIRWVMEQNNDRTIRLKCRESALKNFNLFLQSKKYQSLYNILL